MKIPALVSALVVSLSVAAEPCLPDSFTEIEVAGAARDPDGKFLYCEWYIPDARSGRMRVEYRDAAGQLLVSKDLIYGDDRSVPQFTQIDHRSGEQIRVERMAGFWGLSYQEHRRARMQQTRVAQGEVDVIDAGFDHKIRACWTELMAGGRLRIGFAVPALQRVVSMRVARKADDQCPAMRQEWHCIWVEADNGLVRFFLAPLRLAYDDQRRLRIFNGVVNIRDGAGAKQVAVIEYFYGEEGTE